MTERAKATLKDWLPWIILCINVGTMVVGFSTSFNTQVNQGEDTREAVQHIQDSIKGQNSTLQTISESIAGLRTSVALASAGMNAQGDKLRDLEARFNTLEQRVMQQGERLARKGL